MNKYLGDLNSLSPDNLVNPQVYNANFHLQADPLLYNYHNALSNLSGELSSKNLTGGSFDAKSHSLLDNNLMLGLSQAANNALNSGMDATGNYFNWLGNGSTAAGNQMTSLGNMANTYQGLSAGLQSQLMNPFQQYTDYQKTIEPLQQAQANYYASRPSGMQKLGSIMSAAAPFANFIPGVGPVVAGGLQLGGGALGLMGS